MRDLKGHIIKYHNPSQIIQKGKGKIVDGRLPQGKKIRELGFKLSAKAFKSYLQQYELHSNETIIDVEDFIDRYLNNILELIKLILVQIHSIKLQICLHIHFTKFGDEKKIIQQKTYFCSKPIIIINYDLVDDKFDDIINDLKEKVQNYQGTGSNWTVEKIEKIDVRIGEYNPQYGGCISTLPEFLKNKKALINIKSPDNKCFLYCIIAHLYPSKFSRGRISPYLKHLDKFNCKRIKFPVKINDIRKFETDNLKYDIRINVYGVETINRKQVIVPLVISKREAKNDINLLLHNNHYYLISNFNRFMRTPNCGYSQWCTNCLNGFHKKELLNRHMEKCQVLKPQKVILPSEEDKILKFNKYEYTSKFPYVCYADFECILEPKNENVNTNSEIYMKHVVCGFCVIVINFKNEVIMHKVYAGEDSGDEFMLYLLKIYRKLKKLLNINIPIIPLTEQQKSEFKNAMICHICNQDFTISDLKVKDHDHLTGIYRGAAHSVCNLNYQIPEEIPVLFHNLKYDEHIIIRSLKSEYFSKIKIIPRSMERYISFTLDKFKFLDSYSFMPSSLSTLVNNIANLSDAFITTKSMFNVYYSNISAKYFNLLLKKGIYPYEYMDSFKKFDEKSLPSKDKFYSSIYNENVSDDDYHHAIKVWNKFKCKNLKEYHNLYLLLDTTLLCDVFELFRKDIYRIYGLECLHFYSAPGLSWQAALKMTKIELELLTDIDKVLFIESGIRGGISCVQKKYAKANNELSTDYDKSKPTSYIAYVDANNLYGYAMSQYLPEKNFEWEENLYRDWINIPDDNDEGWILEVDLKYPKKLHDIHKDYPLAPEKRKASYDMLSPHQISILKLLTEKGYSHHLSEKLMLTLYDKHKYICHYINLKFYLKMGLKLVKVHRALKFKQSPWLRNYIKLNTQLRKKAKNEHEKNLYKLLNNSGE
jgi:hypothetical protein